MDIVRRALSPQFIRSLRVAPKGKKVWFADDIVPGLMLRLDDGGRRTFHLSKQLGGAGEKELGEWGRMTLGQARLTARLRIAGLESIESARARAKQAARFFTFAQVCNDYLEQYVIRNRSAQSARTIAMNVLIPRWGTRPFNEITRGDVVELVEEAKGRGTPNAARLQLGQVRMLYSWAISAGRYGIDDSPCDLINTQRLIAKPYHPRERVLTDQEIVALWRASGWLKYPFGDIYRLLLLTGQRVQEVADSHWSEFNLAEGTWTIPRDRHKVSVNHVVMLPSEAVELLRQLPRGTRGDVVFSWDGGRSAPKSNFNYAKRAIGHFMESALGGPVSTPWVTHDIRRTVRTKLAELQVNDVIADIVLGHGRRGMTRVYNRYRYKREVADALRLWADHLMQLVQHSGSSTDRVEPVVDALPAGAREIPLHSFAPTEDASLPIRWSPRRR